MPKLKLTPEGKLTDELGKELSDMEIANLNEVLTEMSRKNGVVDKDAVFTEMLKDKFNLEPSALTNINDIANKVRTEEKNKLYAELESQKKAAKTAEEKAELLAKQQEALQKQLEEATKSGKKDGKESEEAKLLREQLEKLATEKKDIENNFNSFRTEITTKLEQERLATLKANLIASAGGKIIPELVSGNTEEEIKLSVERAKQRFTEIVAATGGNLDGNRQDDTNGNGQGTRSTGLNTRLTINQSGLKKEFSAAEIANMTHDEYKAYRASFLQAAGKNHLQSA